VHQVGNQCIVISAVVALKEHYII